MSDYAVETNRKPKNEEPEKKESPELAELRAKTNPKIIHTDVYVNGRLINPDPKEALRQEATINYTEPEECPFCYHKYIVFRTSDERYSPKRGRKVSNVGPRDYPIWVPICTKATKRDQWGNYEDDFGNVVPHICRVEGMGSDDLRAFVKRNYQKQIEFEKWVRQQLKDIRETAQFKPIVFDRYD